MAQNNQNPNSPSQPSGWQAALEDRNTEVDRTILSALADGRSVDDAFAEVQGAARAMYADPDFDDAEYSGRLRDYYDSRLADLERGGALARQENGSFYVNPEYTSGEGPGNPGTTEERIAEGAVSSRSSSGEGDPANQPGLGVRGRLATDAD